MKKHIITILAALICAATFAQTTTKDTIFVQRGSGANRYVTNTVTTYDGQIRQYKSNVFDTITVKSYLQNMYEGKMEAYAQAAQFVFSIDALVKPMLLGEAIQKDTLGTYKDVYDDLEDKYKVANWVFSNWTFNPGSPVTAPIAEDGVTGQLEITISGTDYPIFVGANWIVLKDYPSSGAYTALFRVRPGLNQFRNMGQSISLSR